MQSSNDANDAIPGQVPSSRMLEPIVHERLVEIIKPEVQERIIEVPQRLAVDAVVEIPKNVYQERIVHVLKPVIQERITHVIKPIIQETVVEVPICKFVEKFVEVVQYIYQEKIVKVPKLIHQERVIPVQKKTIKEKLCEIPIIEYREVPKEELQEITQIVPEFHTKDVKVNEIKDRHVFVEKIVDVPHVRHVYRNIIEPQIRIGTVPQSQVNGLPIEVIQQQTLPNFPTGLTYDHVQITPNFPLIPNQGINIGR